PVTKTALAELDAAHGVTVPLCEDDVRTFAALAAMSAAATPGFSSWLAVRRPASRSRLLTEVLGPVSVAEQRTVPCASGQKRAVGSPRVIVPVLLAKPVGAKLVPAAPVIAPPRPADPGAPPSTPVTLPVDDEAPASVLLGHRAGN